MSSVGNTSVARIQAGCVVGSYEDVILRVQPMTSCGVIFKAFLKRAKRLVWRIGILRAAVFRGEGRPRLVVHGVHMNANWPDILRACSPVPTQLNLLAKVMRPKFDCWLRAVPLPLP